MIGTALRDLERFLLPNHCVVCDRGLFRHDPDGLICPVCVSRMRPLPAGGCPRCRQPRPPVGPCRYCRDWEPALHQVSSAVWLGRETRRLVHGLKYGYQPRLARVAAEIMVRRLPAPAAGTGLVPIPTSRRRLRRRGYNQAESLAQALGVLWNRRVIPDLLRRTDDHRSQTALTPGARLANVAGVFHAGSGRRAAAALGPLLLIDDVLTTGATLSAAAAALAAARGTALAAATFARTAPYEEALDGDEDPPHALRDGNWKLS